MSKGNLFLGFGRGKVGDVVFSRVGGEQVARARNRSPRNPQTPIQLVQRSILKTVSQAYSLMAAIADHSFQGFSEGTECQSAFVKRNVEMLRLRAAEVINSGNPEDILTSALANYAGRNDFLALFNAYTIAEGTLNTIAPAFANGVPTLAVDAAFTEGNPPSYQEVVEALGLQRGDQLTLINLSVNDTEDNDGEEAVFNGFDYARIILEPASGDMTTDFATNLNRINDPNPRNEGNFNISCDQSAANKLEITFRSNAFAFAAGGAHTVGAIAIIVSRQVGGVWMRSNTRLILRSSNVAVTGHLNQDHETALLGDAIQSFLPTDNSSLYLNQAESF